MIENRNQTEQKNRPTFSGRLIVISVIFLVPIAILFYSLIWSDKSVFIIGQIGGYISLIFFLIIYLILIKLITWILGLIGIKWR
ncbi:hypothetical protein [Pedobacter frigiditerrae]|uniref:hypothetical protein n=1 Tax=Pedobacter frigiditerrae TaxID=2530452 RepID=UPI00292E0B8F|nr:hypothetical protein [Pedobacter frigiditerrae]